MTQGLDEKQRIEMALSYQVDPDDSSPLTEERKAELEARLDELSDPNGDAARAQGNTFTADQAHGVTVGEVDGTVGAQSVPQAQSAQQPDIQTIVQAEIAKAVAALGGAPQVQQAPQQITFQDVLDQIDPRDSEAALAMLTWLEANHRISPIATLNGGGGYLWHYQEPKGSSKEGYTPGASKGGRMVDQAVETARESGAKPRKTGMCGTCYSAVVEHDDGLVTLDGEPSVHNYQAHDDGTAHIFVG